MGRHTYLLDGDNVRHGLNKDLGFTEADRVENIRRVAEVARLMVDAGLIVLVSFISPFRAERRFARERVEAGEFCEVFVDTPLAVAEQRDTKGLYKKARGGDLKNFTGIDSPYEPPEHAEVRIDTVASAPEDAAETIIAQLRADGRARAGVIARDLNGSASKWFGLGRRTEHILLPCNICRLCFSHMRRKFVTTVRSSKVGGNS